MTHLVFFGDFLESDGLGVDETLKGMDVTTTTNQLTLILCESSLVFYGRVIGKFILTLRRPPIDVLGKML
jgi:hypothetical protein